MKLVLIAAVADGGAIGRDNALLWHHPADAAHFRRSTAGCPVVMGRRTWESLPSRFRPLPGRRNVVVTRQPAYDAPGAETAASLQEALARVAQSPRVFVIGGSELYAQALPLADELVLTEIGARLEGDRHFPPWNRDDFEEITREPHAGEGGVPFAFVTYRRRR